MIRPRWVLLGTAAFAATFIILRPPRLIAPPELMIPDDGEVIEVRACLRKSQFWNSGIPEFVVPAEHAPIILDNLRPGRYIRKAWNLDWLTEVGYVVVHSRDGSELKIRFFEAGHNPAVLTVDGVNQFYGCSDPNATDVQSTPPVQDGGIVLGKAIERAHSAFKASKR